MVKKRSLGIAMMVGLLAPFQKGYEASIDTNRDITPSLMIETPKEAKLPTSNKENAFVMLPKITSLEGIATRYDFSSVSNEFKDFTIWMYDTIPGGYIASVNTIGEQGPEKTLLKNIDAQYNLYHARTKTGNELFSDRMRYGPKKFAEIIGSKAGRGGDLEGFVQRLQEVKPIYDSIAETYGINKKFFLAVGATETRFLETAISETGALGMNSLVHSVYGNENPLLKENNITSSAQLLVKLKQQFSDPLLIITAYNAGAKTVKDVQAQAKQEGISDAKSIIELQKPDGSYYLSDEARSYHKKFQLYTSLINKSLAQADNIDVLQTYTSLRNQYLQ